MSLQPLINSFMCVRKNDRSDSSMEILNPKYWQMTQTHEMGDWQLSWYKFGPHSLISSFRRRTRAFKPGWATWVMPRWNQAPSSGMVTETSYFIMTLQSKIFCIYDAKNLPGHAWDPWPKLKWSGEVDVKLYDEWLATESVFWRRLKYR